MTGIRSHTPMILRPTEEIGGGLILAPDTIPAATLKNARFARGP